MKSKMKFVQIMCILKMNTYMVVIAISSHIHITV